MNKLCALVIGHKKSSPGALNSRKNMTEFDFNEDLAIRIEKKVVDTNTQRVYREAYKDLPDKLNNLSPDFIISLHCNNDYKNVSGTQVRYYHESTYGRKMAEILQTNLVAYLQLPDRGIKPITCEDGGGYLLRYTNAPHVIVEPFSIINDHDLERALQDIEALAQTYANAIDEISSEEEKKRTKVFISYSHNDKEWLKLVQKHFKVLENENIDIEVWDDTKIKAGEKWKKILESALSTTKIALLLITTDFLASDFIAKNELPPILKAAENDGAKVIPLIVKPSRFLSNKNISQFQAINNPDKPLINLSEGERDEILVELTNTIEDYLK